MWARSEEIGHGGAILLHRRQVMAATDLTDPRFQFANIVSCAPDALLATRARWLIVHRSIVIEAALVGGMPWSASRPLHRLFRGAALADTAVYAAQWGPPDYQDGWASVWDLERLRR